MIDKPLVPQESKPRGRILIFALILGLCAMALIGLGIGAETPLFNESGSISEVVVIKREPSDIPLVQVIMALQPITRGHHFVAGSIGRREWPTSNVPPDVIADESETIGKISGQNIAPGQIIVRSMLIDVGQWETSTPPTIVNEIAYFGRNSGFLFAVDIETGRELWLFNTGQVISPPAVVDDVLYVLGGGNLYAVELETGEEQWRFERISTANIMNPASPVVVDNVVYVENLGSLYAIDAETGVEIWHFDTDDTIISPPTVANDAIYFTSNNGIFYAIDVQTGQEIWTNKP